MSNEIEGGATVTLRLNLQPWLNRNGRIYLALPQQPIGVVNVEWATQGRLLPGKLQSGERTLVYAGPIRTSIPGRHLRGAVVADGRRVAPTQRLNSISRSMSTERTVTLAAALARPRGARARCRPLPSASRRASRRWSRRRASS